ncbi:MAG: glycosyltransferase family 39 protein [Bacteroidales bacterium]|nr:glycosyltransferase family 39 protein [Bacteroidales bacterium]
MMKIYINRISKKVQSDETIQLFIFIIIFLLIFLFLDYNKILFFRPQGIHFTRQTDSLSFVVNYFQNGMIFFQPMVFDLRSFDGKAACEFPIVYYFTAILYFLFGEKEFLLRLINLTIVFWGFLFLFKLIKQILNDFLLALLLTFLFFSSGILFYYANNFLPDTASLGFIFIGWWSFFRYYQLGRNKYLIIGFGFFTLASLIKVTTLINPLTIIFLFILERFKIINFSKKMVFKKTKIFLIISVVSIFPVLIWNLYVLKYNSIYHNVYFLTHIRPIWNLSNNEISVVWDYLTNYWYYSYYYPSTQHFFFILLFLSLFFIKKSDKFLTTLSLILFMGGLSYFLLFFQQFKEHDYYFLTLLPVIVFLVLNSFFILKNRFPKFFKSYVFKFFLLILVALSINLGKTILERRYTAIDDSAKIGFQLNGADKYLDSINVSREEKFVVLMDYTPNGSLYFLNRKGWTLRNDSEKSLIKIKEYIKNGANYMLITDSVYLQNNNLQDILSEKIGSYNGAMVFKIKK